MLVTVGAAAIAVPALAAQRDPFDADLGDLSPRIKAAPAPKPERTGPKPPFHPLLGRPDYGDSEARFGASRSGHTHAGQDVFAEPGTPLVSPSFGVVIEQGSDGARGNHLAIYDSRRDQTYVYMHLIAPAVVKPRERVRPGQKVGAVGCTGSCWGEHLHFEIREGRDPFGEAVDPLPIMREWPTLKTTR